MEMHRQAQSGTPRIPLPSRPLEGLRVVDFGHAAAGPYCAELLSELGASVIKVEPPAGDHFRHAQGGAVYANVNKNKRCVALDLKADGGIDVALRLIDRADVVVESFTPGTMESLGLGWEALRLRKPTLIYASISGFGQTGPSRMRPGYDVVAQAMSGLMAATGEADRPPVRVGSSLIDFGTGLFAAFGVLAALRQRDRDGVGNHVDASLLDTGIGWMNFWFTHFGYTGNVPARQGSGYTLFAPYQVFETKDGKSVFVGVSTDKYFTAFCQALDIPALRNDTRFATNALRCEHRDAVTLAAQEELRKWSLQEILDRLNVGGIPHAPILSVADVLEDPHVQARQTFECIRTTDGRTDLMPRLPVRLSAMSPNDSTAAPSFGEHTQEVLSELGYAAEEIQGLLDARVVISAGDD